MSSLISRIRQPVKREHAERYLLVTLLSFAGSVILTRLGLELSGYPRLGGGELHIAHVLWGGLLLFIASLLPLILANRDVYIAGGFLSGVGVGLFIDEVGKFITQTNDYFYPAAAPIIYAFFLLTVLLYTRVRRPPSRSPRAELYRALDGLAEVLDHDLEPHERAALEARLRRVAEQVDQPELARLARALLDFLAADALVLAPEAPRFWRRWQARLRTFEERWLSRPRLRVVLAVGLALSGLPAVGILTTLALALLSAAPGEGLAALLAATGPVKSANPLWPVARLVLTILAGVPLLLAAGLLLAGRERRGIAAGSAGLLFSLTVVSLLLFYVEQFAAVTGALVQFCLLLGAIRYRQRYVGRADWAEEVALSGETAARRREEPSPGR